MELSETTLFLSKLGLDVVHKETANGGENKRMNIYEVLKAVGFGNMHPGVVYSRLRPTRVWRTLECATTKEECTLESKSCVESVAAPTPALA